MINPQGLQASIYEHAKNLCFTFYMLLDQLEKQQYPHSAPSYMPMNMPTLHTVATPIPMPTNPPNMLSRSKAYMVFFKEMSKNIRNVTPSIQLAELSKQVSSKWREMSSAQKDQYCIIDTSMNENVQIKINKKSAINSAIKKKKRNSRNKPRRMVLTHFLLISSGSPERLPSN